MKLYEVSPSMAWRMNNREKYLAYQRKWRERNPDKMRGWRGLPEPTRPYPEDNICELCGDEQSHRLLALDHCHITKKFRGWLCDKCNSGLALLGDTRAALDRAAKYLHKARGVK